MTVKITYICDKCGKEQDNNNQFWTVGVTANHSTYCANEFVPGKSMQVCRACLESFGIYVQKEPNRDDAQPEIPSVEDLIRELVHRCT